MTTGSARSDDNGRRVPHGPLTATAMALTGKTAGKAMPSRPCSSIVDGSPDIRRLLRPAREVRQTVQYADSVAKVDATTEPDALAFRWRVR